MLPELVANAVNAGLALSILMSRKINGPFKKISSSFNSGSLTVIDGEKCLTKYPEGTKSK